MVRRRQLIGMVVRRDIRAHIAWLSRRLNDTDRQLEAALGAGPLWREREQLLRPCSGHRSGAALDFVCQPAGTRKAEPPPDCGVGRCGPFQLR